MNICMFTNTYIPHVGGVARSVSCFVEDLRKLGHKVLVIAPRFPDTMENEKQTEILRVPAIQNFNGSDFSARIPLPFIINQKIEDFLPDIIHSHHPYLLGDSALRVAGRRDLPLVFTHHTLYEEYAHYVWSSNAMKKFVINLSTAYANCCTHVIAPSKSIADLLKSRGVNAPVTEIPTGIDFESFQNGSGTRFREKAGIDKNTKIVGHVGRLAPEKNLDFLSKAVLIHLKQNKDAKFLIVGDGPSAKQIKQTFKDAAVDDRLILAGKKTGQALLDAYCAMDVFVFSSHSETQGLVVAEAMAAGIPVVALDASGVREVLADRENGCLLPADASADDFAEAISLIFNNPDLKIEWNQAALDTALRFERAKMAERLAALYESVLGQQFKSKSEHHNLLNHWESWVHTVKTEWELLSTKVCAIVDSVGLDEKGRGDNDRR